MKNLKAFTLVELMVTISVLGVVIGLALPAFNKQILNNKSTVLGEDLMAQINLARYEAVKRATRVSMCASSTSTTATPTCTGSWTDGYIIFVDGETTDVSNSVTVGAILGAYASADSKAVIEVKNSTATMSFIRFTSVGTLARVNNSTNPITINAYLTGCKGENKNTLTVGLSGMISAKRVACPT